MNSDDWCVKCAKYLTFGIFETADDSALQKHNRRSLARNKINIYIYIYIHDDNDDDDDIWRSVLVTQFVNNIEFVHLCVYGLLFLPFVFVFIYFMGVHLFYIRRHNSLIYDPTMCGLLSQLNM